MASEKEIEYLLDNFEYSGLQILGFYDNSIKPEDYDAQIARICQWFGIENIFQYDIIMLQKDKFVQPELKTFSEN